MYCENTKMEYNYTESVILSDIHIKYVNHKFNFGVL